MANHQPDSLHSNHNMIYVSVLGFNLNHSVIQINLCKSYGIPTMKTEVPKETFQAIENKPIGEYQRPNQSTLPLKKRTLTAFENQWNQNRQESKSTVPNLDVDATNIRIVPGVIRHTSSPNSSLAFYYYYDTK